MDYQLKGILEGVGSRLFNLSRKDSQMHRIQIYMNDDTIRRLSDAGEKVGIDPRRLAGRILDAFLVNLEEKELTPEELLGFIARESPDRNG